MMLVLLSGIFVTDLPYHVLTLQNNVHVSQPVIKYKTDAYIKEVIILYVYCSTWKCWGEGVMILNYNPTP